MAKKKFVEYMWGMMKLYYPKTVMWIKTGGYLLAGLTFFTALMKCNSKDEVYSGYINGKKVEYIESSSFSGSNYMKFKENGIEYELIDKEHVDLDWDEANSIYNEADLEKIIMKKPGKDSEVFTLEDINSEDLKSLYIEEIFNKGNRDYNSLRRWIFNKKRADYDSKMNEFKVGFDDVYNRMNHLPEFKDDSVKYGKSLKNMMKIK